MATKRLHITQALELLRNGKPCELSVWKATTGDILEYRNVVFLGRDAKKGIVRIKLQTSRQIREFRDVCLFRINDMEVYL
jgi:hypothetical protein